MPVGPDPGVIASMGLFKGLDHAVTAIAEDLPPSDRDADSLTGPSLSPDKDGGPNCA